MTLFSTASRSFGFLLLVLLLGTSSFAAPAAAFRAVSNKKKAYRQKLTNVGDAQYSGDVTIGGQAMRGIFDTGSFETILMSTLCQNCKPHEGHPSFDEKKSKSYLPGTALVEHVFGSGPVLTQQGFDEISVGPLKTKNQTIWEITQHNMDVLDEAAFEAIIGIGPGPKELTKKDKAKIQKGEDLIKQAVEAGVLPEVIGDAAIEQAKNPFGASLSDRSLLEAFSVDTFSVCLQAGKEEPGWLVWDDEDPSKRPGFVEVPVIGEIHWGVGLTDVALKGISFKLNGFAGGGGGGGGAGGGGGHFRDTASMTDGGKMRAAALMQHGGEQTGDTTAVACAGKGCAAVIDSGTSLMAAPSQALAIIEALVNKLDPDCQNLEELPTMMFSLGGKPFELPPEAYVGKFVGVIPPSIWDLLFFKPPTFNVVSACVPLFMQLDKSTQFGDMWILGMPFFRHYYTTFSTKPKRTLHMAKSKEDCTPMGEKAAGPANAALTQEQRGLRATSRHQTTVSKESSRASRVMHIDASKMRIPAWAMPNAPKEVSF